MTPEERRAEIQTQAALYALGALTRREARAFEARLDQDSGDAARELLEFEDLVALLAFGAPEISPPGSLRSRLLDRIASELKTKERTRNTRN